MNYGYARISTADQNAAAQRDALTGAGCETLIVETISGASAKRPKLDQLLDQLEAGDVLTVVRLDTTFDNSSFAGIWPNYQRSGHPTEFL